MHLLRRLPAVLQRHIYEYDPSYRLVLNLVLLELQLCFSARGRRRGYKRVLRELNRQCWLMQRDAATGERYALLWKRSHRGGRLVRETYYGALLDR